jgi:hypothetical protein
MGAADQGSETPTLQFAPDRAAHQAVVTGHINPSVSGNIHCQSNKLVQDRRQALTCLKHLLQALYRRG